MKSNCLELVTERLIKSLEKGDKYKYLGVLEADEVIVNQMKAKMKKQYRRMRQVL